MNWNRVVGLALAVLVGGLAGWLIAAQSAVTLVKTTELQFELRGGFAYVHTPPDNMVEVAFLKDTNVDGCYVPQPGTSLNVIRGEIESVEPSSLGTTTKSFDVKGATITLPTPEATGGPISNKPVHPPAPNHPADTNSEADWADSKWLPYVSPDYPTSSLNPNWKTMIDGRLVLKGGRFNGASPSKVLARDLMWEWRNDAVDTPYQQSISDTAVYKAHFKGGTITITVNNAASTLTKLVVRPLIVGDPVILQLEGKHDMSDPPIQPGEKIKHFCAFYQLMQPIPPLNKQYLPYLIGEIGATGPSTGSGSPGYYCPGDGF